MKNYYDILEVTPSSSQEQIKSQYRLLIQAWHPDRFSKPEWKKIAEEKCKDFNEAYSALSDPVKRKQYDYQHGYKADEKVNPEKSNNAKSTQYTDYTPPRKAETSSPPKTEPPISKPPKPPTSEQPHFCESCGHITNHLRDVTFNENIGMLVMRRSRTIKGHFCKNCIDYYFWLFTGRTMLFGWWGAISFLVNIYYVLHNTFQYLLSRNLERPGYTRTQGNPKFWMASTILGFMLIGYFILSPLLRGLSASSFNTVTSTPKIVVVTSSPTKNPTKTTQPTRRAVPSSTPKEESLYLHGLKCVHWSTINSSHLNKYVCVYGNVYDYGPYSNKWSTIQFSYNQNAFRITDFNYFYTTPLEIKECVVAYGKVRDYGTYLFVSPDINYEDSIFGTDPVLCIYR